MITLCFNDCDRVDFLEERLPASSKIYDEMLIPCMESELGTNALSGTLVYLHTYGSHFPWNEMYPASEKYFDGGNARLDTYDDSVRYTDKLLGELITRLKGLDAPTFLWYIPDHGETPRSPSWRYNDSPDLWELPVFFWCSSQYRERFGRTVDALVKSVDLSLQLDQMLPLLLETLQIKDDRLTESPVPREHRMIKCWAEEYVR